MGTKPAIILQNINLKSIIIMESEIILEGIAIQILTDVFVSLVTTYLQNLTNQKTEVLNDFMTCMEVCKLLGINKSSLRKHTKSGLIKTYRIGKEVLYKRSEVLVVKKLLKQIKEN